MKLKHIIFDMDGLLVDSEKIYTKGWIHSSKLNQIHLSERILNNTIGKGIKHNKQMLFDETGDWDLVNKMTNDRYDYFYDQLENGQVPLMPYAEETLTYLKEAGYILSLASSSYVDHATNVLTHLNLDHFFTNKIFGDQVEETKPSPEIYETIVSMAGFDKEDSIVLEDSLTGLKAAVGAGLKVIWIPTEESRSEKLDEGMEITAQVDHLRDALEIIKEMS